MMNAHRRKMQKLRWMGLGVVLLVPMLAWAQRPEERIETAMARAREVGIPVTLLESKRAEGQAKGIPMDRIAEAIQRRLEHLEKAQQAMKGTSGVDADQLSVGAEAIGAGVSEVVLAEIAARTGRERRSVAIAALTYLVSQGLASSTALERVTEALAKGPEALANLPKTAGSRKPDNVPAGNRGIGGTSGPGGPPAAIPAPGQANPPTPPTPSRRGGGRG